jgi:hypothetical protein
MAVNAVLPFKKWGALARNKRMEGTYHFYTDDYKFSGLWANPGQLIDTHCVCAVEPNYSTALDTPVVLFMADLYKKRWLARYWQSHGIKIFVDLNVEPDFLEYSFVGVPLGWSAYAVRATPLDLETGYLDMILARAKKQAGHAEQFTLVCYSGGPSVQTWAEKNGAVWFAADYGGTKEGHDGTQTPASADSGDR